MKIIKEEFQINVECLRLNYASSVYHYLPCSLVFVMKVAPILSLVVTGEISQQLRVCTVFLESWLWIPKLTSGDSHIPVIVILANLRVNLYWPPRVPVLTCNTHYTDTHIPIIENKAPIYSLVSSLQLVFTSSHTPQSPAKVKKMR